jgi:hypothetical protein
MTLLQNLSEVAGADITATLALGLEGIAGVSFKWNAQDGFKDFSLNLPAGAVEGYEGAEGRDETNWKSTAVRGFEVALKLEASAGIHVSLAHHTFPLASVPKLAEANYLEAKIDLSGRLLEQPFEGPAIVLAEWGEGKLDYLIGSSRFRVGEFGT